MTRPSEIDIRAIPLDLIEVGSRLRSLDRDWVATLAESFAQQGQQSPIEVIATGNGYRLVFGAHRLAAAKALGWNDIHAAVRDETTIASDTDARLREIAENLVRWELSVLDNAVSIAEWRELYEATHPVRRPGRPTARVADQTEEEISVRFALSFSEAATKALGISRRAVFHALKIASIHVGLRVQISTHPIAGNQSELLALAAETHDRQVAIVALLAAEPVQACSVAEAIAIIDRLPAPTAVLPHQRLAESFARLKPDEQDRFFELHADDIDRWLAARGK